MPKRNVRTEPGADWASRPVLDVMTRDVVSVAAREPMSAVRVLLDQAVYHHLPVVDDGRLAGMISVGNLALASVLECAPHGHGCTAGDVMTRDPPTLDGSCSLAAAARAMLERKVGALPVVDEQGTLRGIVTRADLIRALASRDA
jgi:CBS domain-containing protein